VTSVAQILRQRTRDIVRPYPRHRPKSEYIESMRKVALSNLLLPGMDQDGIDNANAMLEMVGDMLTCPRAGWYPAKPNRWRA
jgi:hypothetical protein